MASKKLNQLGPEEVHNRVVTVLKKLKDSHEKWEAVLCANLHDVVCMLRNRSPLLPLPPDCQVFSGLQHVFEASMRRCAAVLQTGAPVHFGVPTVWQKCCLQMSALAQSASYAQGATSDLGVGLHRIVQVVMNSGLGDASNCSRLTRFARPGPPGWRETKGGSQQHSLHGAC